jgi:hypothetical protein
MAAVLKTLPTRSSTRTLGGLLHHGSARVRVSIVNAPFVRGDEKNKAFTGGKPDAGYLIR